jgi:hypothetical protein
MTFWSGKRFRMARVAAIALAVIFGIMGCSGQNDKPDGEDSAPVPVYIETGYVPYTVSNDDGTITCDTNVVASAELVRDGTVTVNGTPVTTEWAEEMITVTFDGTIDIQVIIVNDQFAALPQPGVSERGFTLDLKGDFAQASPVEKLVVCGGWPVAAPA